MHPFENLLRSALTLFVLAYRVAGSTHLGGSCRFQPSCSEYAMEALRTQHPGKALWLITRRIWRCRPGGSYGLDPVPSYGEHHVVS